MTPISCTQIQTENLPSKRNTYLMKQTNEKLFFQTLNILKEERYKQMNSIFMHILTFIQKY